MELKCIMPPRSCCYFDVWLQLHELTIFLSFVIDEISLIGNCCIGKIWHSIIWHLLNIVEEDC